MSKTCKQCGAKCCEYFCFEIDEPDDYEEFEDVRWYLCHKGVTVHVDDGDWYIAMDNRCNNLTPDNQCAIYDDRPLICRTYAQENCDFTGGDYGYDEFFQSPQELMDYARKVLGSEDFERERKNARAKLEAEAGKKTKKKTKKTGKGSKRR